MVGALADAVAAHDDADARALLLACVGAHTDPDACALVLARWSAGPELELVRRVLQWSESARVRAAAAATVRRLDPSEACAAWLELEEASAH
jgi:hypothetical protein